jgi:hypothetical protein
MQSAGGTRFCLTLSALLLGKYHSVRGSDDSTKAMVGID